MNEDGVHSFHRLHRSTVATGRGALHPKGMTRMVFSRMGLSRTGLSLFALFLSGLAALTLASDQASPQTLRVALDPHGAPILFPGEDGRSTGLAVELLEVLASRLELELDYAEPAPRREHLRRLLAGEIDIYPGLPRTVGNPNDLVFTSAFAESPVVIVTRRGVRATGMVELLRGARVAIATDSPGESWLREKHARAHAVRARSDTQVLSMVALGQVDAGLVDLLTATALSGPDRFQNLRIAGFTDLVHHLHFALPSRHGALRDRIDRALAELEGAELEAMKARWLELENGPALGVPLSRTKLIGAVLLGLAVILVAGGWGIVILRRWRHIAEDLRHELAERQRAEESLRESQLRFRALFERAMDGIALVDTETMAATLYNPAMRRMLGYDEEEFAKVVSGRLESSGIDTSLVRELARAPAGTEMRRRNLRLRHKDGTDRITDVSGVRLDLSDGRFVLAIVRDVTREDEAERKRAESEALLRSTFQAIPDLLTVHDRNLRIVYSNWHEHEYVSELDRARKPYCYEAYMHRDTPCEECHAREVFESGVARRDLKTNPIDGHQREIHTFPVRDENGVIQMVAEYVRKLEGSED